MSIRQLLQSKRSQILHIAARHGARKVRVFGAVARGDSRPDSDIDFLVDMEGGRTARGTQNKLSEERHRQWLRRW